MADAAAVPAEDEAPRRGRAREFATRLLERRPALAALIFLIAAALIVACVPPLLPYAYDEQDFELLGQPTPPSPAHWLGGDELGRDALARVVQGGRVSLAVGLFGALVSTILGTCVGALAGFHRGLIDSLLMRATDVFLSIPLLPLVLLISGLLRPSVLLLVFLIGFLTWMSTARLVRAQFLALREREFVEA
ncbi:MAG TPA: ABC transporter permease, partial [Stellaceae bacterium]|nr:ABC transporter permease [Stellaceae bacterium]